MVGWRFGYRDGAGMASVLWRMDAASREKAVFAVKLQQAKWLSYSLLTRCR